MSKFKHHFFVCTNSRPPFMKPSCGPKNSPEILSALVEEADRRGLLDEIKITACGCLGPCEDGPMIVVYPEGVWYHNVQTSDVPEIVQSHMVENTPVARLRYEWPDEPNA
ncbi:MAG: (2Fe-2S) ferredoxin domain-containing protein [Calditrichaeota bacterium]|nr:MAG: (2Fe-2S) ferredoxin domain-containing protein [Calditrichota bacterium]